MDTTTMPKFEDLLEKDAEALCAIIVWWMSHANDTDQRPPRNSIDEFYKAAHFHYETFRKRNVDHASKCSGYASRRVIQRNGSPRMLVKRAMKLGFIEQAMRCSQALDKMGWPK